MSRKPENKKKAEFVPNTTYTWDPEQEFVLTGAEIQKINNAFMAVSNTPEFQRHAVLYEGIASFSNFFKEAVEDGLIHPQEQGQEKLPVQKSSETATGPKKAWLNEEEDLSDSRIKETKGLYSGDKPKMAVVKEEPSAGLSPIQAE